MMGGFTTPKYKSYYDLFLCMIYVINDIYFWLGM